MAKTTPKSSFAVPYAQSLLELANEQKQAEQIRYELNEIAKIVSDSPSFGLFLADPAIGQTERDALLKQVFTPQVSPLMNNFLGVVNEHGRLGAVVEIAETYSELLDAQQGKIDVDVTVATRLSPQELENVRQKVSSALKKEAIVHQIVDDSIIGGLILRVQDKLIDASVRSQLAEMKKQLLTPTPK